MKLCTCVCCGKNITIHKRFGGLIGWGCFGRRRQKSCNLECGRYSNINASCPLKTPEGQAKRKEVKEKALQFIDAVYQEWHFVSIPFLEDIVTREELIDHIFHTQLYADCRSNIWTPEINSENKDVKDAIYIYADEHALHRRYVLTTLHDVLITVIIVMFTIIVIVGVAHFLLV